MIHFNRKTEYAILAIEHMARKENGQSGPAVTSTGQETVGLASLATVSSTREIADAYHIPYPLLAKVLQKLAAKGMVKSVHGTKGGYVLARQAVNISVADVVEIFDGPVAVAECFRDEKVTCPQWDGCHIKEPFYELNHKIHELLVGTKIADLTHPQERRYAIEPNP